MIRLYRVSKRYPGGGASALEDVSLDVEEGELVFLTGPSGAGKSTLLRLITAEEPPSGGELVVLGRNAGTLGRRGVSALRRDVGVVYQDPLLLPEMTVFGNVELALEVRGVPARERGRRAMEALIEVGLKDLRAKRARALSAGEQQRAALARAVVGRPRILLADEPTGNLDPDLSREILALLLRLNAEGMTMIVATHAWEAARASGRRVLRLERGRLVADSRRAAEGAPLAAGA